MRKNGFTSKCLSKLFVFEIKLHDWLFSVFYDPDQLTSSWKETVLTLVVRYFETAYVSLYERQNHEITSEHYQLYSILFSLTNLFFYARPPFERVSDFHKLITRMFRFD